MATGPDQPREDERLGGAEPAARPPAGSSPADAQGKGADSVTGGRRVLGSIGAWVNSLSYLPKWLLLASVIGVIAGFGAIVFYKALDLSTHFFLADIAGYHVPSPAGEGGAAGDSHFTRPWAIPLVVVIGALLSGLLVFTFAPEAEGHGTDAAIDAIHHNPRGIRLRAVVVKIVASALTIGAGGSGGREGPTAQISAGFGSLMARSLDLEPKDGRIAVSVGVGSGIGAIFGAPLAGAVLAADIVYREDFEFSALLPGAFASIISYSIFGAVFGYQPLFAMPDYQFNHPIQLVWFAVIGLLAGLIGLLYSKSFYGVVDFSKKLPISKKFRPAIGGLLVGLMALWIPEVLGTGYGWVQQGLSDQLLHVPLYIILLLPLARIVATSLSIGTGGSGGVFGPGMVIGAFTGLAVWRILEPIAPGVGSNPAPYVVIGMMAVFGSISRAALAVMLMVAEMTGSFSIIAPAMVAVSIAWFIVGRFDDSIYRSQLRTRADSAAGRLEFALPLLATLKVGQVAEAPRVVLAERTPPREALRSLRDAAVPGAPVVDAGGTYVGTVDTDRLADAVSAGKDSLSSAVDTTTSTAAVSASLDVGLDALTEAGGQWVPVTRGDRRVVGVLSAGDVIRGYREALESSKTTVAQVTPHAATIEEYVGEHSELIGRSVRDAGLPAGCVIVTVQRGTERIAASGSTVLAAGDVLSVLVSARSEEEAHRRIRGSAQSVAERDVDQLV